MEGKFETENITGGTLRIVSTAIQATPIAADCREWDKITVYIVTSGTYNLFIQLKGNTSPVPAGGQDIGSYVSLLTSDSQLINLGDEFWAPFIYAEIYGPQGSASYPSNVRIDVIKRR